MNLLRQWDPPGRVRLHDGRPTMGQLMTAGLLRKQNEAFRGSGGISASNRSWGFLPAFRDTATGMVFVSRFADGRLAPVHMLEGLPGQLVAARAASGGVTAAKDSLRAGFLRGGRFYTREEAARAVAEEDRMPWSAPATGPGLAGQSVQTQRAAESAQQAMATGG